MMTFSTSLWFTLFACTTNLLPVASGHRTLGRSMSRNQIMQQLQQNSSLPEQLPDLGDELADNVSGAPTGLFTSSSIPVPGIGTTLAYYSMYYTVFELYRV